MKMTILSVQATSFKDKDNGTEKLMWKLYIPDKTGAVGCLYSAFEHKTGESIEADIVVNRDGKLVAKIIESKVVSVISDRIPPPEKH